MINYLKRQSFQPTILSVFFNPFFFIRNGLYKNIKINSHYLKGDMLDFGCGRKPYKNLFNVTKYVGVDIEISGHPHANSEVDVFYDGKVLPFSDETFDSFFCSEVFEHVFNIEDVLWEIHRVLKKGGSGLITIPFAWPEHEIPYDFGRYTSFAIRSILERHGFKLISVTKSGHFFECISQLLILYIYSILRTNNKYLNVFGTIILISPLNILGIVLSAIAPKRTEFYHNLIIIVEKEK